MLLSWLWWFLFLTCGGGCWYCSVGSGVKVRGVSVASMSDQPASGLRIELPELWRRSGG